MWKAVVVADFVEKHYKAIGVILKARLTRNAMERIMCEKMLDLGPDIVAVVLAIEERFNITIPDEEAEKIRTMGQLYDFVFARVARGQAQVCFTSATFYRLRRTLGEVCHVPRERIRPQIRLEDLVPLHDRRRYWQELQGRLGKLPCLRRPHWLVKRIEAASYVPLFIAILFIVAVLGVLGGTPTPTAAVTLAGLAVLFVGIPGMVLVRRIAIRRTEHYAVHIPPACATVRDLVYAIVSWHSTAPMVSDTARASDKEIWKTLCAIVGGEFDRSPDSFTRDSTFT